MAILVAQNIVKSYGSHRALDGVSFQVEAGVCYGLLGPNGAGKTTLLSILSCFLDADAGSAQLDGQSLTTSNRQVRPWIGIAPQEIAVYHALTARENLLFFGRLYQLPEAHLKQRVDQLLAAVGLEPKADHRVETFSGGMQRRLNFAAALVHEPKILLLDEPTAGVDPHSRNLLFEEIKRCTREGMTILYTSHYMEEVEALCSRVAIIDHGKVVANDTVNNLLDRSPSQIKLHFDHPEPLLMELLEKQTNLVVKSEDAGKLVTLQATGAARLLAQTVRWLHDAKAEPTQIESESTNLERVFLQLTGRALRD